MPASSPSADHGSVIVTESTALPYRHDERALAGLQAKLRHLVPDGELPKWSTLAVTGPEVTTDPDGRTWFEYRARVASR